MGFNVSKGMRGPSTTERRRQPYKDDKARLATKIVDPACKVGRRGDCQASPRPRAGMVVERPRCREDLRARECLEGSTRKYFAILVDRTLHSAQALGWLASSLFRAVFRHTPISAVVPNPPSSRPQPSLSRE
jgi:hypothetical protein